MKLIKRIALICACSFLTNWLGSIAVCEYYTYRYRETFENTEVHDIDGIHDLKEEWIKDIKVLEYTDEHAAVYVKTSSSTSDRTVKTGSVYYFDHGEGDSWTYDIYDTIWSSAGSADEFIWPYIR